MQKNPNLSDEQKNVLFNKATEAPFSGKLLHNDKTGIYMCANCSQPLFTSDAKFDSGSGWPSFYQPKETDAVNLINDSSHGMQRTEVTCKNCSAHLGHLFDDAHDQPTGQRFCINSASLDFNE